MPKDPLARRTVRQAWEIAFTTLGAHDTCSPAMKVTLHTDDITKLSTALVGLYCFEDGFAEGVMFRAFDRALDGLLSRVVADEQFKGKKGQTLSLHTHGRVAPQRLLLVGGGQRK